MKKEPVPLRFLRGQLTTLCKRGVIDPGPPLPIKLAAVTHMSARPNCPMTLRKQNRKFTIYGKRPSKQIGERATSAEKRVTGSLFGDKRSRTEGPGSLNTWISSPIAQSLESSHSLSQNERVKKQTLAIQPHEKKKQHFPAGVRCHFSGS